LLFLDAAVVDFPARALRPEAIPGFGQCKPRDFCGAHDQEGQMANSKLTDTQRVVLAAVAAKDSGLVLPLPASLGTNQGTHGIILKSLITRGLIAERPAQSGDTVWQQTDEFGRITLSITAAGLEAIGIAASPETEHHEGNIETGEWLPPQPALSGAPSGLPPNQASHPRAGSKLAILIDLLSRSEGATIPEIMAVTSWQAHSIRGAISGALKKKLGLTVVSEPTKDRGRVYRIGQPGIAKAEATPSSLAPSDQGAAQDAGAGEGA
jgi:hypothetical protein